MARAPDAAGHGRPDRPDPSDRPDIDVEEQVRRLRDDFGMILREDFGPLVHRPDEDPALEEALRVPYYALLYNANVVPEGIIAQRGRLEGSLAIDVQMRQAGLQPALARSRMIAKVLCSAWDEVGAITAIQPLEWDDIALTGTFAIEVAEGQASGDSLVSVTGGDLGAVLEAVLEVVRPVGVGFAVSRDPVALRDDPGSGWRWVHAVDPEERTGDFAELAGELSLEVLALLLKAPEGSCGPLTMVPDSYLDVPGIDAGGGR